METLASISSLVMSKLFVETFWVAGKEEENVLFVHSAAIYYCVIYGLFKFNLKVAHSFP